MTPQLDLIGIVVADRVPAPAFYRRLGLDVASDADAQPTSR